MFAGRDRIVVLGAGLAGLAAAIHLADAGLRPLVLEAAQVPGGRARSRFDPAFAEELDNGPHLLMGAYSHTLQLLSRLGTRHLLRTESPPAFTFWDRRLGWHALSCPDWPAPWHLLAALFRFPALSLSDRWAAIRLFPAILESQPRLERQSVTQWLVSHRQTEALCQRLWHPLCLATLNESAASANAALFVTVLKKLFLADRQAACPMLPTVPLSQLFANPAQRAIEQMGGELFCRCRVQRLEWSERALLAIHTDQGICQQPKAVVAALPHTALARLLPEWAASTRFTALQSAPIVSVHLTYAQAASLPAPLVGLPQESSQWLLDRNRLAAAPADRGRFSAVLSGAYRERTWSAARLIESVHQDLVRLLPVLASTPPAVARVIKEHRATFAAWPETTHYRPPSQTPWHTLWLAGEWTETGLPGTLEGAVQSGRAAAQKILDLLANER